MEVAEQHSGLRTCHHQDKEHQEQEAKHVISLGWPDGIKDEEELDEDATKGQHASHDDTGQGLGVHALFRDLPGDLVGSHWVLQTLQ